MDTKSTFQLDDDIALDPNLTVGDQINNLQEKLTKVNDELHRQVAEKHGALLQQATQAGRFDTALNSLADEIERIREVAKGMQKPVEIQYQLIENQTKVQFRMNEISHLLRSAASLLTLSSKLKGTKDLLKKAELHYELSQLMSEDLTGIDFVQKERTYVMQSYQKLKNLTQMQLVTGLQERNENQVVYALKIILNLNTLDKSLDNLLTTVISNLQQSLKECFAGNDISQVINKQDAAKSSSNIGAKGSTTSIQRGPGKTPQLTTTQNFRAKFWKSLHWFIYDELYECCVEIRLLKHALEEINQFNYVAESETPSIQKLYWQKVQNLLRKSFTECPSHVTQTLQEGLSKLLTSSRGLEERLNNEFLFDNDIFEALEVGYVQKCSANMKACLAGVDLPNNETVDNLIRIASTELSAALIDQRLTKSIASVFISCGKDLCTKLEAQIKLGPDTRQVIDTPNTQQIQNQVLGNVLFYYKDSVRRMLNDLGQHFSKSQTQTSREDIFKSLEYTNLLISTILQQITESIMASIKIIILSMHREPGLNSEKIIPMGISLYMKELQEFVARSWIQHVVPFEDTELTANCGLEMAKRTCDLFIHNLCILRPLSKAGRQRLKADCGHLEKALKPMCPDLVSELGKPARLLRAISFLIVQEPKELIEQSIGEDSLVPSYLVLFLLFGWAGSELQSPHTTVNWSNERLIEWLDGHTSEREKLELISGALQRYRDSIRRKKSQQYDEVYPMMVEFFEKTIKYVT